MSQHFHLEASLLGVHGLQFKLLVLHDANFRFALILPLVEEELGEGKCGLLLVDQLGSVLLDLALNGLFGEIDGCEEVIGRFLGADKSGFRRNCDLDNFGVFPTAQNNARLGLGSKVFLEFPELFVHLILQSVAQFDVSSANGDTHTVLLLSNVMQGRGNLRQFDENTAVLLTSV